MARKKTCVFCAEKVTYIDYKNLPVLKKYTQQIKVQPRYYSGNCLQHHKKLARAIKHARFVGLLAFTA